MDSSNVSWISNLRNISVAGVIVIHVMQLFFIQYSLTIPYLITALLVNLVKFATIFFFIFSGYLFQVKYDKYRELGFIKFLLNKLHRLLLPYFVIFILPDFIYSVFINPNVGIDKHSFSIQKDLMPFIDSVNYC